MSGGQNQGHLTVVPLTLADANKLVANWHRHHVPAEQSKFCLGVCAENGVLVGAAIVGRAVARCLDDAFTLEVNRCVTDGTPNACSALYGAAARVAKALGYRRVFTYTRFDEEGASLRGAGWVLDDPEIRARSWAMPNRKRTDKTEVVKRKRWVWASSAKPIEIKFPQMICPKEGTADLFAGELA